MPVLIRSVTRSKNTIRFSERVNPKAVRDFIPALDEAINRGHDEIVLDFRRSELGYADGILPIICLLDHRRQRGNSFKVLLPEAPNLRQLFLNANWAHFMDPSHPGLDLEHPLHVPARRYRNHSEQHGAVDSVLDVVLRSMDLRRDVIRALEWSVNEITDNVLNHAQSPEGGIVQVSTFRKEHKIKFVVADSGRGVPAAMREAFPRLGDDAQAINEALKAGVTSIPDSGQGNGLAGSLRIACYAEGSFMLASGKAHVSVFRDERGGTARGRAARPEATTFPAPSS